MENNRVPRMDPERLFGDAEALHLHQLRLLEWMVTSGRKRFVDDAQPAVPHQPAETPDAWELTKGVEPHPWQHQCMLKWRKNDGRGTVKVVTGAGKTMLALFIAQLVQNTEDKDLHLVVVVPTIVLMHQWYDAILRHGNVPPEAIGRLGGGYDEGFIGGKRILISVLASASERLPKLVKDANVEGHLMLV